VIHELRLYLDTSVLAACYHREPFSDEANGILALAKRPAISPLVELEMASALARKQRSGELSLRQAYDIEDLFRAHLDEGVFTRLTLTREHFQLARQTLWASTLPLTTLDALHAAVAALDGRALTTADRRLAAAAEDLGVKVLTVGFGESFEVHEEPAAYGA
jgi:hypothetical protein